MRKAQTYKYKKHDNPFAAWDKAKNGSGPGIYTTAIVEMPDGTIKNIPVENIEFLDKPE